MNPAHHESSHPSEGATAHPWEMAKEAAANLEERGGRCLQDHAASAVVAAFGGGLLLGSLLGWTIAKSRYEGDHLAARRFAPEWRHRFHCG